MIKLKDGELIDLLQEPFKNDPDSIAISYALKMAMAQILGYSVRTRLYSDIDNMPEYILDYMATEMRLAYYEETFEIEKKRELIKNSYLSYMRAGTKGAVEDLANRIYGYGTVVEWPDFHDGPGTPGTFDIETDAQLTPDIYEQMVKVIERVKNESSHVRHVSVVREVEADWKVYFGKALLEQQTMTDDVVIDNPDEATIQSVYIAMAEQGVVDCFDHMDMPDYTVDIDAGLTSGMALTAFSRMSIEMGG